MAKLVYGSPRQYNGVSRYSVYNTIINVTNNLTYLETINKVPAISRAGDTYHIVEPNQEGRLDIISSIYYSSPDFYWIIAQANNIIDPFTVIAGTILKIPKFESIYDKNGALAQL